MHPDMLILAERLVIAMEAMSQDVKNMSAYVYDISCSVSYLLNERRENERISVEAYDECDDPSSATAGQYEQADERQSWYMDPEQGDKSFGDIGATSIDPHENSDVPSSESYSVVTGGIKIEEQFEANNESSDLDNTYDDDRNNIRFSEEVKCETQLETEEGNQPYGLLSTTSHSMGGLNASESIARIEFASNPNPQDIQRVETSSNSAGNSERLAFVFQLPEQQMAGTSQMESAKNTLMPHRRVHSKEKSYKCSVCQKSFKEHGDLMRHALVHSGERPYKCDVCGKAFTQSGHLTHHIRIHTGERPYKCDVCGKTCLQKSNLTVHMRSHSGERPYKCNMCGKAFVRSSHLTLHMRSHTGERPYQCTICGRAFSLNLTLRDHMRTHTGERPYRCTLCGMSFGRLYTLNHHMRTHSEEHRN